MRRARACRNFKANNMPYCIYPVPTTNGRQVTPKRVLCVPAIIGNPATPPAHGHCPLRARCVPSTLTGKPARITRAPVKPAPPAVHPLAMARARARAHAPALSSMAMRRNLGHAISQYLGAQARALASNPWVQCNWLGTATK